MSRDRVLPRLRNVAQAVTCLTLLLAFGCSDPEVYKPLVEISEVALNLSEPDVLRVSLDYELAPAERLPLPYSEIVVSPLEPEVKVVAALEEFILSVDTVIVKLGLPPGSVDWQALRDGGDCCLVSLKGLVEAGGSSRYERISNHVRVPPPPSPSRAPAGRARSE